MSSQKTIKINPDLFKLNHTARKKFKKPRKEKPTIHVKPTQVKKELLNKIKEHQKRSEDRNYKNNKNDKNLNNEFKIKSKNESLIKSNNDSNNDSKNESNNDSNDEFNDEFNKSLNFLQELSKNKQEKKLKKTLKKKQINEINNVNLDLPIELQEVHPNNETNYQFPKIELNLKSLEENSSNVIPFDENCEEKPYGCLKNGNKPTFREWRRHTLKKNAPNIKIQIDENFDDENFDDEKLNKSFDDEKLNKSFDDEKLNKSFDENLDGNLDRNFNGNLLKRQKKLENLKNNFGNNIKVLEKKTRTTRYKLGKLGNHVSVLIKNNDTRKKIREDYSKLKKINILEIKNYLRKRNLIKAGCNTPNDVLRQIYEKAILSGEITNMNKENLLHNYFTE